MDPSGYNIIVGDEGYSMVFRLDATGNFLSAPLADQVSYVTSVARHHLHSTGRREPPPARFNGHPGACCLSGRRRPRWGLSTDENATCRLQRAGGRGLRLDDATRLRRRDRRPTRTDRCRLDQRQSTSSTSVVSMAGNANTDDFVIAFTVCRARPTPTSKFTGPKTRCPRAARGIRRAPGPICKDNGAFATV